VLEHQLELRDRNSIMKCGARKYLGNSRIIDLFNLSGVLQAAISRCRIVILH